MSTVTTMERPIADRVEVVPLLLLTAIWVLFWGTYSLVSVVGGLLLSAALLVMFPLPPLRLGLRIRPWPFVVLVVRFVYDLVIASVQVAYYSAVPWFSPRGYLVSVSLRTDDDLFATITAEMTALVPGTVVVDVRPSERLIVLHIFDATEERLPTIAENIRRQEARVVRALARDADEILGGTR